MRGNVKIAALGILLAALLLHAVGCGGDGPIDEDLARSSLTTALDAWKAGGRPSELRQYDPEIVVGENLWDKGRKLVEYKVDGPGKFDGRNLRVPVTLTVRQPPRAAAKMSVVYIVGVKPVITVFRENPDE